MMHQSEFHAANVALSRAADKRKSLINIALLRICNVGKASLLVLDIESLTLLSRLEFLNNLRSIMENMFLYCYPC